MEATPASVGVSKPHQSGCVSINIEPKLAVNHPGAMNTAQVSSTMAVDALDAKPTQARSPSDSGPGEELLCLLARQSRMALVPVTVAMSIIAYMSSQYFPAWISGGWMALVISVLLARWLLISRLQTMTQLPTRNRLRIAAASSTLNAIIHALSLAFFSAFTDFERSVQTMILMGISTISIITTAGYRPISLAYLIPTLLPLFFLWAWNPGGEINTVGIWFAVTGSLYTLMLFKIASASFRMFLDAFESRQQLSAVNEKLQAALKQAESASQAKTRFLASVSHDLRQPLQALSLFSAALNMRELDERSRSITSHMNLALEALSSQLNALLDTSRLDAGVIPINPHAVNLSALLARLREEFIYLARSKNLTIILNTPPDTFINTDEVLFERIVRNLIVNSIKYTDEGSITLEVVPVQDAYLLRIIDTGQGISPDEQIKIFEEFYQSNNPQRDQSRGMGLGLAIVKRLLDLLMIEMTLESTPGEGSCFTFTLLKVNHLGGDESTISSSSSNNPNLAATNTASVRLLTPSAR